MLSTRYILVVHWLSAVGGARIVQVGIALELPARIYYLQMVKIRCKFKEKAMEYGENALVPNTRTQAPCIGF
eukprot:6195263-Pleurochrysis_carterae.AAC.3